MKNSRNIWMAAVIVILSVVAFCQSEAQIFTQQGPKLLGSGYVGKPNWGEAVAITQHGNGVLVSGPSDNSGLGALWYFIRTNGVWSQLGGKIVPPESPYNLGYSIGISFDGTTAIANTLASYPSAGAWIFTRSGSVWSEQTRIIADSAASRIGAVAISGDGNTAMTAEYSSEGNVVNVYVRNGGTWTKQATLVDDSGAQNSFGGSISLSAHGYTALIGGSSDNDGCAWIFVRSGTTWTRRAKLVGTDVVGTMSGQGVSVALSSDATTAMVGGHFDNNNLGAAWVFTLSDGNWIEQAKLVGSGSDGMVSSQGYSVSISGDGNTAIIGGPYDGFTPGAEGGPGATWVFTRSNGVWTQQGDKLRGSGAIGASGQGIAVALSSDGGTAVVGGPADNPNWENLTAYGASWIFTTQNLLITSPALHEVVLADEPYTIRWKSHNVDSVRIAYSLDSGKTFFVASWSSPAAADSFVWDVPDTLSSKCVLKIVDLKDPLDTAQLSNFKIKGYVLTRFTPNGDYERFFPWIHGWQFGNDTSNMWPASWWSQFDYVNGSDPYTTQRYPAIFKNPWELNALESDFPDWPLFVKAFGINQCYTDLSSARPYSPIAAGYWRDYKTEWGGSCFGFSVSSLLAFDFPSAFTAYFPDIPSYIELYELNVTDTTRRVINQLWQSCMGTAYLQYKTQKWHTDPRQTLQDLKKMFLSEIRNDQTLYLYQPGVGAHSVVPFELKRVPNTSKFNLVVYDNNCPGAACKNGVLNPTVQIDSAFNTWSYPPLHWGSGIGNQGLFLEPPVSTFLNPPDFPWAAPMSPSGPVPALATSAGSYVQVFNTTKGSITISDSIGNTIGFHDSTTFNTFTDGIPIIPATSKFQPPIGYYIPDKKYSIQMSSYEDTVSTFSVFGDSGVFSYRRTDAAYSQTDHLSYNNGIDIGNPDSQTKNVDLEAIATPDSSEHVFQVLKCSIAQHDSVMMSLPNSNQTKFMNLGPQKSYDLGVVLAGRHNSGQFFHTSISMPANSTHYIIPDWLDIQHQPVKIYEDIGNTGTITDSIFLTNQLTGVIERQQNGIPDKFALEQNYPNPFNPSTTISYQLPTQSNVTLKVFDVLGREIETLVNGVEEPGYKSVMFDASRLSSGIYYYQLRAGKDIETKRLLLLR